jgi:putative hemolysin
VLIDDVNDELALHLPTDGADTIGGLVLDALGRLPQVGEVIEVDGIALRVTQMRRNWIAQVAVPKASVVPPASEEDPGTEEVEPEEHSS